MKKSKKRISYLLIVSILINVIFLCGGYAFIAQAKRALFNEKSNYMREISLKTAQNIESYINGYLTTVEAIAAFVSTHDPYDIDHVVTILRMEAEKNGFKRMGVILKDGTAITTDGKTVDFSDREYFAEAMKGKSVVSDKLLVDKVDGKEINVVAAPVFYNGAVEEVIFATKTQEDFANIMQISSFGGEGYSYIITADGSPVVRTTHPNSVGEYTNLFDEISKNVSDANYRTMKLNMAQGLDGTFENRAGAVRKMVYYSKVGINDWWLISVVPSKVISFQSDKLIIELTIFMLLVVLALSALCIITVFNTNKSNKRLQQIAFYDKITGFYNWDKFIIDAKEMLDTQIHAQYALVSLDIKKFSVLNDLFGHARGDNTLKAFAVIINETIGENDIFARVSDDKFAILMQYENREQIVDCIAQLSQAVRNIASDYTIEVFAGIYLIDKETASIDIINDRATIARNVAKQSTDSNYSFFDEKTRLEILKDKEIENAMHEALKAHEFAVYLQPKYSVKTERVIGAEALVRWQKPDGTLIPPNDFIPLFEKNGFIRQLDLYVFEQVCFLLSKWRAHGNMQELPISVNISRVHISDNHLPQKLLKIMEEYQINPEQLEFELTESAVYADTENMKSMMRRIRSLGIRIAIDDFGCGYSSLGTLKDLPIDVVKLGLKTVAEGIETIDQIAFLKATDCDIVQGYYYSRPIQAKDFEALISI